MNGTDVVLLVDYHYWATWRVIDVVRNLSHDQYTQTLGSSFSSIRDTLVHLYAVEWLWCSRWLGESPSAMITVDELPAFTDLRTAWEAHEARMRDCLASVGGENVAKVIEYRTTTGEVWYQPFWHMVLHVVNHGTHHRAQVVTMLRQLGEAPATKTDFLYFSRESAHRPD